MLESLEDGEYIIKKYDPPRNLDQNALYWTLIWYVSQQSWNDTDYLHEMMKNKYLNKKKLVKLWKKRNFVSKIWSTTKLSRKSFSEFFQKVEQFFAEVGYILPPRDSNEFISLYESSKQYY